MNCLLSQKYVFGAEFDQKRGQIERFRSISLSQTFVCPKLNVRPALCPRPYIEKCQILVPRFVARDSPLLPLFIGI